MKKVQTQNNDYTYVQVEREMTSRPINITKDELEHAYQYVIGKGKTKDLADLMDEFEDMVAY